MEYYQFLFKPGSVEEKDILIALLETIGFTGFEEEENTLKGFIKTDAFIEENFNKIIDINNAKYSRSIIKEINWNEKWEAEFEPVTIPHPFSGLPFVYLRAGFHPEVNTVEHDINITPKMSFGTGHHATTYQMVQQMGKIDFKNKKVIDFGTGTAVLAILAEKLGASKVIAIDNDDWSINNARENIITNHCNAIELVKAETISNDYKAAVILANINLNIIIENLAAIKNACEKEAIILFSGIMLHDESAIISVLKENSFMIKERFDRNGWLIICAQIGQA